MLDPIINKVANSKLVTIDLEDYKTEGSRIFIDVSQWLEDGFLLREKPFRDLLQKHEWTKYKDHYVALDCTSEAVLPAWATLLITSYLTPYAKKIILGSLKDLEKQLFSNAISELDLKVFENKPLMIKGCSDPTIPESAYIELIQRLQTVAKSLFYGEACSSVPLWKAKK
tara:strand:- start:30543 stop:31052 length:510 start_codon:yes stop_codon:yes gene_type:complete